MNIKSIIPYLVILSGLAALNWEVLWQIKISLSLGISSWGTALTLAITMGGMSVGALLAASALRQRKITKPLQLYGILEILIGLSGLILKPAFGLIETIDTAAYNAFPSAVFLIYLGGVILTLSIPTLCLGATVPVLGLVAQKYKTSLAYIYGLNTLGAAAGTLIAALILVPSFGLTLTIFVVSALNILVGIFAITLERKADQTMKAETPETVKDKTPIVQSLSFNQALFATFVTGFATFSLEIAWFRSLTAAFMSTTDAFAIMLACVLIGLGAGAQLSHLLKMKNIPIGLVLSLAGILILLATPLIERFDYLTTGWTETNSFDLLLKWFSMTLVTTGLPVMLLGAILPWLLNEQETPKKWGTLYGMNAFASILGALFAAWFLLPTIGFTKTAWGTGLLVIVVGLILTPPANRSVKVYGLAVVALFLAITFNTGAGVKRVQGNIGFIGPSDENKILAYHEGPDATIAAIESKDKWRALVINGFIATAQHGSNDKNMSANYMKWMGHLPMIMHPDPKKALIIAFGTGQTAHAVRQENPESIDIVDLNKHVLDMAPIFTSNEGVLKDSRVTSHVMDGRAYIRRTQSQYDVITLEPMPPNFAGVNALYSYEFYKAAREKMTENGVIAQWLPFHLVAPEYCEAIAKAMQQAFPNTILWVDPKSSTGILVGSKDNSERFGENLYGLERISLDRGMSEQEIRDAFILNQEQMREYTRGYEIVNDDNQLLAYGRALYLSHQQASLNADNQKRLKDVKKKLKLYSKD